MTTAVVPSILNMPTFVPEGTVADVDADPRLIDRRGGGRKSQEWLTSTRLPVLAGHPRMLAERSRRTESRPTPSARKPSGSRGAAARDVIDVSLRVVGAASE
ncbi:hypothetical protein ABIB25_001353 [Nakamurella sp. UYEF19]|uniref:hypothetical protein n=1 Tax=Nakamurella sp. UYEF19 TaxID=1756392 RepID=UPI0033934EFD